MSPPGVTTEAATANGAGASPAVKKQKTNGEAAAAAGNGDGPLVVSDPKTNTADARTYEYVSACNPDMPEIPPVAHPAELHSTGASRVIPFDLSKAIGVDYQATSPNLLAAYVRVCKGEKVETQACATSQAFYVISGKGVSKSGEHNIEVHYNKGDLFVMPHSAEPIVHEADPDSDVALYWVSDEPLLKYLGVAPNTKKFAPTVFRNEVMVQHVEELQHAEGAEHKNRLGILLGNKVTEGNTLTLTHTLWSLLNFLPKKTAQPPHRHNSVALDLCVFAAPKGVYTLMGPELGEDGWVKDPIRLEWSTGGTFVTPPGWWHSHHNDSDEDAWVLPMQDAGLYTQMRSLDIRFSKVNKWPRME